jgi:hypothetical protein
MKSGLAFSIHQSDMSEDNIIFRIITASQLNARNLFLFDVMVRREPTKQIAFIIVNTPRQKVNYHGSQY